ncbi:MAG: TonB-dependent receptor [Lysobacterales bacterium]|nr:MAG: TonB-dependent receptor [Xanthomonadales bacterium]
MTPPPQGRNPVAVALLPTLLLGLLHGLLPTCGLAQAAAADPHLLEEVVVHATRIATDRSDLPFAASVVSGEQVQRGRQQLGLDEALASQPGLFFQNRYNFAQDLRIAIRGFGARANFGIRGIRIFADDIPQTLPDGQGSVDAIDLGSVEAVEVIRGPFSAVYGSASGGVIHIRTEDGPERPQLSTRLNTGSYGFRQWQAKAGGEAGGQAGDQAGNIGGRLNWLANLSSTELDGYREQSRYRSDLFNSKIRYDFDASASLTVVLNAVDSPRADDPGGLTAAEVAANRRQAAPRNVQYAAGEALDQQTLGLALNKDFGRGRDLLLRTYYQGRDFVNRQPFDINSNGQGGSVDLQRRFAGFGAQYGWSTDWNGRDNRLIVGFDYDAQRDHRRRFVNLEGVTGALTTDQDEDVTTAALFVQDALELGAALTLTLGGRFDDVEYRVTDRTGAPGSGQRSFTEFSPMLGVSWALRESLRLYGNVSTSFDPPATTELANPYGPTGFNPDLESQTATNAEAGVKGLLAERVRYEAALFHIDVQDEIVPYELAGSGQSFFRNAGSSTHRGAEASLALELLPGLSGSASYTWSDFTFNEFRDPAGGVFDGNRIPGIPEHLFQFALDWSHPSGFFAGLDLLHAGSFFADNANAVETGDYRVVDLRGGCRWQADRWMLEPFAGVSNLLDEQYMTNIRLNAAFGRYYEPAPERNLHVGVLLTYGFP